MKGIENGPAERLMAAIFGEDRSYYSYIIVLEENGQAEKIELMTAIQEALTTLLPRDKEGLELRFRFDLSDGKLRTFEEVGKEIAKLTPDRGRQIVGRALRKLRHPSRSKLLRQFIVPSPEEISNLRIDVARLRRASISLDEQNHRLKEILKACGVTEEELEGVRPEDLASAKKDWDALQALIAKFPNHNHAWNPLRRAGINRLSQLEYLVRSGKIRGLKDIGKKREEFFKEILQK